MTKYFGLLAIALLISVTSFSQNIKEAAKGVTYGEVTNAKGAIPIADLAKKMDAKETLNAKVKGKVLEVCTKKGCWMNVESGNGETTRVTFKDYAFFMPQSLVGKTVVLDGVSTLKTTEVAELKHYAEDAGKSKEEIAKITKPKKEVTFEAKGVLVL
ncbi:DUF4920 domain-containing protein [Pedobacter alpinus]|uniref:DUF4920 domain-containing protein n=1 Tax=Pedobacter alpinus TaxID=1590643 RepID=A0ABW5TVR2_9SPHI